METRNSSYSSWHHTHGPDQHLQQSGGSVRTEEESQRRKERRKSRGMGGSEEGRKESRKRERRKEGKGRGSGIQYAPSALSGVRP